MKKKFIALLLVFCLVSISVFMVDTVSDAGSSSLNVTNTAQTLEVGKSLSLKVNGVKSKKVKWKSSNKSVITVSNSGTIKAIKQGSSTISGKYRGITFKTKITVTSSDLNIPLADNNLVKIELTKISNGKTYLSVYNKTNDVISANIDYLIINESEYSDETECESSLLNIAPKCTRNISITTPDVKTINSLSGVVSIWEGDTGYLISYVPVNKK